MNGTSGLLLNLDLGVDLEPRRVREHLPGLRYFGRRSLSFALSFDKCSYFSRAFALSFLRRLTYVSSPAHSSKGLRQRSPHVVAKLQPVRRRGPPQIEHCDRRHPKAHTGEVREYRALPALVPINIEGAALPGRAWS